jgi:deazaflavin-dependent oxidoreductase (nitroreductase family)
VEERGPVGGADGDIEDAWASLDAEPFCYVTSIGRVSRRRHTIEIWFSLHGATVYMLSGRGRASDWVRNIGKTPAVRVRIGGREFKGRARIVTAPDEDHLARQLIFAKYQPGYEGDLSGWRNRALPIAIDLSAFPGRRP